MPLSLPTSARETLHQRDITLRGFKRTDGNYDIEGHLLDTKAIDFTVASGLRPAGKAIHSMWLRITIDRTLTIIDAEAASDDMPYEGYCNVITPDYKKLIGLAIRPGYSNKLKELLGGVRGCTHITELAGALATAAFQTMAGQGIQAASSKPFQLDGCHALKTDQPAVARYYPKWYTGAEKVSRSDGSENH